MPLVHTTWLDRCDIVLLNTMSVSNNGKKEPSFGWPAVAFYPTTLALQPALYGQVGQQVPMRNTGFRGTSRACAVGLAESAIFVE